ncbi:hypothetical protein V2J09_003051 [Rumex salicifolius]
MRKRRARMKVKDMRAAEAGAAAARGDFIGVYGHPDAFQVAGPRHVKEPKYRRKMMACFVQATYLLELDRQENRTWRNALAPNWWLPFKYKLVKTLIDERDGSIFGALFEWDRASALKNFILARPRGAPKAVLTLRGTLLKGPTFRRDLTDDLRFLAWESLKGSVRYNAAISVLRSSVAKYGSKNMCVAGHSLGAGFALQAGRALAEEGVYVEAHLFNPPSFSITTSLKGVGERVALVWKQCKTAIASRLKGGGGSSSDGAKKWVPHLYINDSDYICCQYSNNSIIYPHSEHQEIVSTSDGHVSPKMMVSSKENQKFLEAHQLKQWWADDLEIETVLNHSKLITQQLQSLYSNPTSPHSR